jgi:ATP-dependent helicase YprA (DUF1998 family)
VVLLPDDEIHGRANLSEHRCVLTSSSPRRARRIRPTRPPRTDPGPFGALRCLSAPLPPALDAAFGGLPLWAHQAEAIDHARAGRSVVVATGTASGKSLCYQLPIAEVVTGSPPGSALLVFPTKALAQDQLRSLTALAVDGLVAAPTTATPAPRRARGCAATPTWC